MGSLRANLLSMETFKGIYAAYYDLMYGAKDYRAEVDFYLSLIKKYKSVKGDSIISFGAGTLNHEGLLARRGFEILGVEYSADMVRLARQKLKAKRIKNIIIKKGDMRSFQTDKKYDIALSMFNVVSYCQGLPELKKAIASASKSLVPGGIFIFDFWNARAVRKSPPRNRWTKFKKGSLQLYRLTDPTLYPGKDFFELSIELFEFRNDAFKNRRLEKHRVSSWDISDIKKILRATDLKYLSSSVFLDSKKPLSDDEWSGVVIAKKS